jgi:hypothetical protein
MNLTRAAIWAVPVVLVFAGTAACSAILGIGDPTYDAGTSPSGSTAGSGGSAGNGSGSISSGGVGGAGSASGTSGAAESGSASGGASTGSVSTGAAASGNVGNSGSPTTGAASGSASTGTSSVSGGAAGSMSGAGGSGAVATAAGIGDPCASAACDPGLTCSGKWCTETCTTATQCGTNELGKNNACEVSTSGSQICFPGCSAQLDCAGFAGTQCFMPVGLCANAHGVGDVCSANGNECSPGLGCGSVIANLSAPPAGETGWCGNMCAASSQCAGLSPGGTNLQSQPNYCVVWNATTNICAPGCSSDADCQAFTGTSCGNWGTDLGLAATCGPTSTTVQCRPDMSVAGCATTTGYSCEGNVTPEQENASLVCTVGVKGNRGLTLYCCQ